MAIGQRSRASIAAEEEAGAEGEEADELVRLQMLGRCSRQR